AVDDLNAMVEDIANGGEGKRDVQHILDYLKAIENGETPHHHEQEEKASNESDSELNIDETYDLDEFELSILNESKERGFKNLKIDVELNEACLLKGVRVFMVFDILEKSGEIIKSNPSVYDLEEENFEYTFSVILVTKEEPEAIEAKINKVSEISHVKTTELSFDKNTQIDETTQDRKSTRLNSSHVSISYAVFCLKKKRLTPDTNS